MGIKKSTAVADIVIRATRGGEWLPAGELRTVALSAVRTEGRTVVNLGEIEYLDGDALQILLALARERKSQGCPLVLAEVSENLARWFEFAGVSEDLSPGHEA